VLGLRKVARSSKPAETSVPTVDERLGEGEQLSATQAVP
jgi:hypothetical protein